MISTELTITVSGTALLVTTSQLFGVGTWPFHIKTLHNSKSYVHWGLSLQDGWKNTT